MLRRRLHLLQDGFVRRREVDSVVFCSALLCMGGVLG